MRQSASLLLLTSLLATTGCAPFDAEIKGSWHIWLAANSSNTVDNEDFEGLDEKATRYECVRTWDEADERWADGYIGPREDDDWESDQFVGNPCQAEQIAGADTPDDESDDEFQLLDGLRWIPPEDNPRTEDIDESAVPQERFYMEDYCSQDMMRRYVEDCGQLSATVSTANFLRQDGYYAMKGDLEPWRTEAILTGEGHLQIAFHQDVQGEDWQLIWTIDPDFKPETCISSTDGEAEIVQVDQASWVEKWSEDEDGHDIYYINSGAYHSPDQGATLWYYPRDWTSGNGYGKFIGEEFLSVQPVVRNAISEIDPDLLYDDEDGNGIPDEQEAFIEAEAVASAVDAVGWVENAGASMGDWQFETKLEDNLWRPLNTVQAGLDGWTERNYSWVRIKDGSKIQPEGKVSGDFQVVLAGLESNSRFVVQGSFEVDELRVDKWSYPVLEDELRALPQGEAYCR
ncbi:MAG TPA: hypothetical protein DFR83_12445 [Deltaproteobacteria bacterium]|nr:hypothetical protein [Deltaproteobacteria bacterium]